MSKAEEKAQAAYPAWRNGVGDEFSQNSAYYGFIEGYHQAVKNLELTWKDIEIIGELRLNVALEFRRKELESPINNPLNFTKEDICQEVLKRFKEQKGE